MREYKFHEVIALLTDDYNLKFQAENFVVKIINGKLMFISKSTGEEFTGINTDDFEDTYTIYKEEREVPYIEALRVLNDEGKIIKVQKADTYNKKLRDYTVTSDMNNFEFSLDDIKYGKWFIID